MELAAVPVLVKVKVLRAEAADQASIALDGSVEGNKPRKLSGDRPGQKSDKDCSKRQARQRRYLLATFVVTVPGSEHMVSIGSPGLYSIFWGAGQPCSGANRLGRPFSSASALAVTGFSSFFICSKAELCTTKFSFLGRNMISRSASSMRW